MALSQLRTLSQIRVLRARSQRRAFRTVRALSQLRARMALRALKTQPN